MRSNASNALVRTLDAVRTVVRQLAACVVAGERSANEARDAAIRAEGYAETTLEEVREIRRDLRELREERRNANLGQKEE